MLNKDELFLLLEMIQIDRYTTIPKEISKDILIVEN